MKNKIFKVFMNLILLKLSIGNAEPDNNKNGNSLLNKTEVFQNFGDSIFILRKKNYSDLKSYDDLDDFDNYFRNHVIRIKSPNKDDQFYDFQLVDLLPDNKLKGRARRQELKKILLPILVALKLKSTILIPIFLAFVALIAIKGFWAGMTALFVSKAVALKVFFNTANNRPKNRDHFEDPDDYEDYGEYHPYREYYDDHRSYQRPQGGYNNQKGRPIVIYLNDKSKPYNRYQKEIIANDYEEDIWASWRRDYLNWDRQKWKPSSSLSDH